jgi:CRISPR/Cas system-associated exonuclease Cas4 (RecB family)
MEYFLDTIAGSLYREFGNTLNRHCLVFPNRRAGLFFLKYLASHIRKPVWEPSVLTINELFRSHSSLQVAGNEVLLFELYKVYRRVKKSPESFDNFFYWGDILLNDFDDVDKYLVDASQLFKNVLDIKNIDHQFGGLNEEQIEIIRKFWINFNPEKPTDQKAGFISIWSVLNDIYTGFRTSLREQNMAYEGMIFRDLAENKQEMFSSGAKWDLFHFIGFNALNECEKQIMTRLKNSGKARFYWDYDESFISDSGSNSAGYFLRDNLRIYGNNMPEEWSCNTLLSSSGSEVKRQVIDTSSDVAQVKLVPGLLKNFPGLTAETAHNTAVVLSDENLLIPMLSSLPEAMGDVNITMGYPLKQTMVYTLVRNLMDLQRNSIIADGKTRFRYNDVGGLLRNSLVSSFIHSSSERLLEEITKSNLLTVPEEYFSENERLSAIFTKHNTPILLSAYFRNILSGIASSGLSQMKNEEGEKTYNKILNEFIYRIVLSVNMLDSIVRSEDVAFSGETYMLILDRMLRMQAVPFAGEPLSGIQIMGILETRALDFKNLIILSVNEGVLPAVSSPSSSYIPFSLREAFRLPSVNHQESIYAYHFYRLLQRAEDVTFVYNSNPEGLKSGEMSRFLIQMMYNPKLKPARTEINPEIRLHGSIKEEIERRGWHNEQLLSQYSENGNGRLFSPSAVNTWLSCRMKFYYRYVNRLKEPSEIKTEIDPAMLGDILHEVMKKLYADYEGRILEKSYIGSLVKEKQILYSAIDDAVRNRFQFGEDRIVHGNEIIVRDVLLTYLIRILNADISLSPLQLVSLEKKYSFPLALIDGHNNIVLNVGGIVDRIDILNGTARVVDYKTGSVSESPGTLSDLFADDRKKDSDGWLQTLIYCEALQGKIKAAAIRPSIYKIKKGSTGILADKLRIKTDSKQDIVIEDYSELRSGFIAGLTETMSLIFSESEPFRMTDDRAGKCRYCSYKGLCMR